MATATFKQVNGRIQVNLDLTTEDLERIRAEQKGGPGSGNFGHSGRPGQVGGAGKGGTIRTPEEAKARYEELLGQLKDLQAEKNKNAVRYGSPEYHALENGLKRKAARDVEDKIHFRNEERLTYAMATEKNSVEAVDQAGYRTARESYLRKKEAFDTEEKELLQKSLADGVEITESYHHIDLSTLAGWNAKESTNLRGVTEELKTKALELYNRRQELEKDFRSLRQLLSVRCTGISNTRTG